MLMPPADDGPRRQIPIDDEFWGQLRAMAEYIGWIHHHIDPDRFDIDADMLARMKALFERPPAGALTLSYRDISSIQTVVWAAATYLDRGDPPSMDPLTADDCWERFDEIEKDWHPRFRG